MIALIVCAWVIIGAQLWPSKYADMNDNDAIHAFQYITDNSAFTYESKIAQPIITDSKTLWLVNCDNSLASNFIPENLVTHRGIRLHALAYNAYNQLLDAMKADGIHGLQLVSAYRPYEYQYGLFSTKVQTLISQGHSASIADELAAKIIQRPGASEHQTGLALDVTIAGDLTQSFADTIAGRWLAENSHIFGFIIRYPQTKTDVTNIIYEPWHLRYVGVPHAIIMYNNNLALEEYAEFIRNGYAYIHWEGQVFYLVAYSGTWPEKIPQGLINISSDRPGEDGKGYIMAILREQTTYH